MTLQQIRIGAPSLDVSIVMPVYNEELNVDALAGEINGTMRGAGRSAVGAGTLPHSRGTARAIPPM